MGALDQGILDGKSVCSATMTYRTKRPRLRSILTFGVGATLAITQLGAGCAPGDGGAFAQNCSTPDGGAGTLGDGGQCVPNSSDTAVDGGSDGK
jgi:hypothetical protein